GQWKRQRLRLKERHGWKAKPGYLICVIGRGAIRFDYPQGFHVDADEDSLKVRDQPHPHENCRFAISQMHLPVELADQVPGRELVKGRMKDDDAEMMECKDRVVVPREDDIELAYIEYRHMAEEERRELTSRIAVGRGSGVYCLITYDVWSDDKDKF